MMFYKDAAVKYARRPFRGLSLHCLFHVLGTPLRMTWTLLLEWPFLPQVFRGLPSVQAFQEALGFLNPLIVACSFLIEILSQARFNLVSTSTWMVAKFWCWRCRCGTHPGRWSMSTFLVIMKFQSCNMIYFWTNNLGHILKYPYKYYLSSCISDRLSWIQSGRDTANTWQLFSPSLSHIEGDLLLIYG